MITQKVTQAQCLLPKHTQITGGPGRPYCQRCSLMKLLPTVEQMNKVMTTTRSLTEIQGYNNNIKISFYTPPTYKLTTAAGYSWLKHKAAYLRQMKVHIYYPRNPNIAIKTFSNTASHFYTPMGWQLRCVDIEVYHKCVMDTHFLHLHLTSDMINCSHDQLTSNKMGSMERDWTFTQSN